LHQLIRDSLSAVGDVDVRKDLASSILLTGACSLIPQLEQRLSWQVSQIISTAFKPKVLASRQAVERSCASWIGGSILTSLGSFQQLWLGRSEYEEYGATLAIQRFP
jgi:actin-like protein 6A